MTRFDETDGWIITARGAERPCAVCKGTGSVDVRNGIFKPKIEKQTCNNCNGEGKILIPFTCPHMSLSTEFAPYGCGGGGDNLASCIMEACSLWDHTHGGGCLERKKMLKDLYPGESNDPKFPFP